MFSFLTSFSGYIGKIFAKPAVPHYTIILDDQLSKAISLKAFIFTQERSSEVEKAIQLLDAAGLRNDTKSETAPDYGIFDFDTNFYADCDKAIENLHRFVGRKIEFPIIFVKGNCVGGLNELQKLSENGILKESLKPHDYDLVVIGGGSGGLAAAKKAADSGIKVAVFDFVKPTPIGTTWGLGGTCVNVGCIPKKLMHQAAILGKSLQDARKFGWQFDEKATCDWKMLVDNVHNYILGLNWNYKSTLREKKATYFNAYGSFIDSHTVKGVQKNGQEVTVTGDKFLIATGLRPRYLDVPGAKEFCITSDDLFTLPYPPGKTLVIGASYVALECAGFLHGCGFEVTVMVRSILLRGFDQDMAERIGKHMEETGIKFIRQTIPTMIEKIQDGKPNLLKVTAKSETGEIVVGEYNTVLLAIGRDAITDELGLDSINVTRNKKNKKLLCFDNEQNISAPHVYAIGDVLEGAPELTPVAIQAGRFLVTRLFEHKMNFCEYINVPTTVFTPLEYGCAGYSEEDAELKFGDKLRVYHTAIAPLEFTVAKRTDTDHCYSKLLFVVDSANKEVERLVGFHVLSPNAGEITQGFAIALKTKATKEDFRSLIGIHPTVAESLTFAWMVPKVAGEPMQASGC